MADDQLNLNKAAVRLFLESVGRHDLDGIRDALAEGVVQHYVAPSQLTDDGTHGSAKITSREAILEEIGTHFHGTLYRRGTVTITIQNLVAEGDLVAGRFILEARTVRGDRPYKNFYHFLYRCEGGRVVEYWEYLDTKYADETLWRIEPSAPADVGQ
jgi:ketosteroid isomerase-like protein